MKAPFSIEITRTDVQNEDFIALVSHLDRELADRDGTDHRYYAQFNKINRIKFAVIVYMDQVPVGCGAIKAFDLKTMEIKRMYVSPESRNKGIAKRILIELEEWATQLSCSKCILETGKRQAEAVQFYKKNGYQQIQNYGQYTGIENSLCFEKELK